MLSSYEKIHEAKNNLIINRDDFPLSKIYPHEHILNDRLVGLKKYINSLDPYIILPSIIICKKTNTIIDGHHRYYALIDLQIEKGPVTLIDYDSDVIITDRNNSIQKTEIINAALKNKLLPPKTTEHHLVINNKILPLILLSDLRIVKK